MWFQLDPDRSVEHAKWAGYHGLRIVERLGLEYAVVPIKCEKLKDGKCSVYKKRPQMCRDYHCKEEKWLIGQP